MVIHPCYKQPIQELTWKQLLPIFFPRICTFNSQNPLESWTVTFNYWTGDPFNENEVIIVGGGSLDVIQENNPDDEESSIGTRGLGPCIAIIGIGFDNRGKRVSAMYHWTGPELDQDIDGAAENALDLIKNRICNVVELSKNHIDISQVQYFLLGSDSGSRRELGALQRIGNIPEKHIVPTPYEVDGGWDVLVKDDTIYFGTEIII